MVNIACLISNGYDILLIEGLDKFEKDAYMLPECSAESIEAAQQIITERLSDEGILFDFEEVLYEGKKDGICYQALYLCHTFQWTNQMGNTSCKWVRVRELECSLISSAYKELLDATNNYLARREKILSEIKAEIAIMHDQSQVKIEMGEQFDSIIFWLLHPNIYVPFCLEVKYMMKNDNTIDFQIRWQECRQYAPGDKSDLYVLFAETMALLLKLFNEPVYVSTYNFLGTESEINGAEIVFEGNKYSGTIAESDFAEKVIASFEFFNFVLGVHGMIFGSLSNDLADDVDEDTIEYLGLGTNYIVRKESACYYNRVIGQIKLFNNYYDGDHLMQSYSYELLMGVTGSLLFSSQSDQRLYTNYIAKETLDIVHDVINHFSISKYTIICQNNRLYLLTGNSIWFFVDDYHHSNVDDEKKLIFDRQAKENALFHVNRDFKWVFPVNSSRFEQLIADIIECRHPDSTVRLVGKTNNPDGGRDIIIRRQHGEKRKLTICQCKAYQRSVNKNHVTDIRDTLDYYEATGFLLAVTSDVTVPLIDHLTSLSQKYDVDWWTGREIFKALRQYPIITERYKDIVIDITKNKE